MIIDHRNLTAEQRVIAVQRLTALWAFTESGLGGIMHALQIPFTGLLVGGMAVVMICMIAEISEYNYKQVLKSALIVLIVKAMVSPHTPFPAYIAVGFQALLGYGLFSLLGVNFFSILLLSTIAMAESAIQKILILTIFLGDSLWTAMDKMISFLASQFGMVSDNGSYRIAGLYLLIYIAGGVLIAWLAHHSIKTFYSRKAFEMISFTSQGSVPVISQKKSGHQKLWLLIILMIAASLILFLFAANGKQGWLAVTRTIIWTTSAILIWYVFISPLFTKLIKQALKKKQGKYSDEVLQVISFLPVLRRLTALAWQQSKKQAGIGRWYHFLSSLIHWSLIYSDNPSPEISSQPKS